MLHGERRVTTPTSPSVDRLAAVVAEHQLDPLLRSAHRVQEHLGRIVDPGAGDRRRLGARVAHHDRAPEARAHLLREVRRHRRRAGGREPERREVDVGELRQIDEFAPLRRHALTDGDAFAHHRVEHRLHRPGSTGEHRVDDELDLVPELVHVARVRERHRHESHVVVRAEDVAEPGRRLHGAVVEPRTLRESGRAAGPHDADRIGGVATGTVGELGPGRPGLVHLGARHRDRRNGRACGSREGRSLVQQRDRLTPLQDRGGLRGTEARVDAGRDRTEARARGVRDRVVDARRQRERHDLAGLHSPGAQLGRERIGTGEPLAVREALVAVDVRECIGFARADLLEEIAQCRARDRGRRDVAHASTAAQPSGSTPSVVTVRLVMSHSPSTTPNSSR